jgi:hypothetical protein
MRGVKARSPRGYLGLPLIKSGDDLLSHAVANAVPSALKGLTSVFGMGTGVSPPLQSPENRSKNPVENQQATNQAREQVA